MKIDNYITWSTSEKAGVKHLSTNAVVYSGNWENMFKGEKIKARHSTPTTNIIYLPRYSYQIYLRTIMARGW